MLIAVCDDTAVEFECGIAGRQGTARCRLEFAERLRSVACEFRREGQRDKSLSAVASDASICFPRKSMRGHADLCYTAHA